jgi:hypothetical protein
VPGEAGPSQREKVVGADQERPSAVAAAPTPDAEAAVTSATANAAEQESVADKRKGRRNAFELMLQVRSA